MLYVSSLSFELLAPCAWLCGISLAVQSNNSPQGGAFISIYRFLNSINIVGVALRVFIQIYFAKCLTLYFEYVYIVIIVIHFHRTQLW